MNPRLPILPFLCSIFTCFLLSVVDVVYYTTPHYLKGNRIIIWHEIGINYMLLAELRSPNHASWTRLAFFSTSSDSSSLSCCLILRICRNMDPPSQCQFEVVFTAIKNPCAGETVDFCGKRATLDAEEVGELLAVERNVEFCLSTLFSNRAEIGHNAVFPRVRQALSP